jgi:hypothetical protein
MSDHQDRLNAKVNAVNAAHTAALDLFPKLRAALLPFVGRQVVKADGYLMQKVQKALPELPAGNHLHCFASVKSHTLHWHVKADATTPGGHAFYHEVSLYVGTLDGGTLKEVWDAPPELRTDYTAQEVQEKRKAYEQAKKAANDAQSALHPFGEYDH